MNRKLSYVLVTIAITVIIATYLLTAFGATEQETPTPKWLVPQYATAYSLANDKTWPCPTFHMLQERDFPVESGPVAFCYYDKDQSGFSPYQNLPRDFELYGQSCRFELETVSRNKIVVFLQTSIKDEQLMRDCLKSFYIPAQYHTTMLVADKENDQFRLESELLTIPVYISIAK